MTKVRQDAWSHEDDQLLTDTVLRHIKEGSTQLKAFEEVGDILNRTSAACAFRWSSEIRGKNTKKFEAAKRIRIENQKKYRLTNKQQGKENKQIAIPKQEDISPIKEVIETLKDIDIKHQRSNDYNKNLEKENKTLKERNEQLEKELSKTQLKFKSAEEDYQTLVDIMNRARKMVALDSEHESTSKFKMDKNGNLERIAK